MELDTTYTFGTRISIRKSLSNHHQEYRSLIAYSATIEKEGIRNKLKVLWGMKFSHGPRDAAGIDVPPVAPYKYAELFAKLTIADKPVGHVETYGLFAPWPEPSHVTTDLKKLLYATARTQSFDAWANADPRFIHALTLDACSRFLATLFLGHYGVLNNLGSPKYLWDTIRLLDAVCDRPAAIQKNNTLVQSTIWPGVCILSISVRSGARGPVEVIWGSEIKEPSEDENNPRITLRLSVKQGLKTILPVYPFLEGTTVPYPKYEEDVARRDAIVRSIQKANELLIGNI